MSAFVLSISQIDKRDIDIAGKFAAELGELSHIGIPMPKGFIVTASCFREFLIENKLTPASAEKQVMRGFMSNDMVSKINNAYKELGGVLKESKVSVISSSPFSFEATHYEVKGDANLILKIKEIWAAQFSKISLIKNSINNTNDLHKLDIAIVVQKKIESEKNGRIFTEDPATNDKTKVVIEQGKNTAHYLISKKNLEIIFKGHLTKAKRSHRISDKEAILLAFLGRKIEKYFYFPQEIRFAIHGNIIYILETKPVTSIVQPPVGSLSHTPHKLKVKRHILLKGASNFPGIATGPVKIITDSKDLQKINPQEIIVLSALAYDLFPKIKRAGAIVVKNHSLTGRDKFLYRIEVGKPSILNVRDAGKVLHTGNVVTVDGAKGEIYKGGLN
ncbi:MAG: PEP/pyruvate-binding domain-containing protein [Patescibacteria group bacterium]